MAGDIVKLTENIIKAGFLLETETNPHTNEEEFNLDHPMRQAMYIGKPEKEGYEIQIHGKIIGFVSWNDGDFDALRAGDYLKIQPYDEIQDGIDY